MSLKGESRERDRERVCLRERERELVSRRERKSERERERERKGNDWSELLSKVIELLSSLSFNDFLHKASVFDI